MKKNFFFLFLTIWTRIFNVGASYLSDQNFFLSISNVYVIMVVVNISFSLFTMPLLPLMKHIIFAFTFFYSGFCTTKTKRIDLLLRPYNNRILCVCVSVWKNFRILVFPAISHIFIHFIRLHASCACIRCHSKIHKKKRNSSSFFFFFCIKNLMMNINIQ